MKDAIQQERAHSEEKEAAVERASFESHIGQLMTLVARFGKEDIYDENYKDLSLLFQKVVQSTHVSKLLFVDQRGVIKATNNKQDRGTNITKQYDSQILSKDQLVHYKYNAVENIATLRMMNDQEFLGHLIMHYSDLAVGVSPH